MMLMAKLDSTPPMRDTTLPNVIMVKSQVHSPWAGFFIFMFISFLASHVKT